MQLTKLGAALVALVAMITFVGINYAESVGTKKDYPKTVTTGPAVTGDAKCDKIYRGMWNARSAGNFDKYTRLIQKGYANGCLPGKDL